MNSFASVFKSFSTLEISLLIIFILYLVLPIQTPGYLAPSINSSFGMIIIFIVTIYLFFYSNPILAIIYIFVGYELLRRSSVYTGKVTLQTYTPSQAKINQEMIDMNPPKVVTVEEEVISKMAPIPHDYVETTFRPIMEKNEGSLI